MLEGFKKHPKNLGKVSGEEKSSRAFSKTPPVFLFYQIKRPFQ
jgi:hypothetical protein